MINPATKPSETQTSGSATQPSSTQDTNPAAQPIYIGKRPAVDWDERLFKDYAALSGIYRVGNWNGNGTVSGGGDAPFSCLGTTTTGSKPVILEFLYDADNKALVGFNSYHSDNVNEWYGWAAGSFVRSTLTLADDEVVVKMETKAFKPPARQELLVQGLKLTTSKGQVWTTSPE